MASAEVVGSYIVVTTTYRDGELIRMVPGARYKSADHVWHIPVSFAACTVLSGLFGDRLEIGPGLSAWVARHEVEFRQPALALRESLSVSRETPSPYLSLLSELLDYQRHGV